MTDRLPIGSLTVVAFVLILGFLAFQLEHGRDPALGAPQTPAPQPRRVLLRRIVRRVVVVHVIPAGERRRAGVSSAARVSPPPPTAVPAPLPAPAPVSRSS